jgi:hypothetical protein
MKTVIVLSITMYCFAAPVMALTADEILQLKKNGVSDRTIELMLQKEIEQQKRQESEPQITETDRAITYSTGKPSPTLTEQEQRDLERAWKMLEGMTVKIREKKDVGGEK